jgi:hypothetical protein
VHLPFRFGIHLYGFFAFKKKSPCMYNFGDAMWFASGEDNNDQEDIYVIYFL